jgi:transcriptional regulator with XRE-family HTH domain
MSDITANQVPVRTPYGTLSNAIYRLRLDRQLTQVQLAKKIQRTQSAVASYESGRIKPSYETAKRIAQALNVSVDLLTCHERTLFAKPKHGP